MMYALNALVLVGFIIYFHINIVRNKLGRTIERIGVKAIHLFPVETAQHLGLYMIKFGLVPNCRRPETMKDFLKGTVRYVDDETEHIARVLEKNSKK